MEYAPNKYRSALHGEPLPDGNLTDRQRAIVDAVRGCSSIVDFRAKPLEHTTSVFVCTLPYNSPNAVAETIVRAGIVQARAELDQMEDMLNALGPPPFMPSTISVPMTNIVGKTRKDVLLRVFDYLRHKGLRMTHAGDRRVLLAADGQYVVEPEEKEDAV